MTVNLAFIGAGGIADRHANVLKRIDEATISVVCDIDRDKAEQFKQRHQLQAAVYREADKALAHDDLDAVILLTPRGVREPIIELCIQHNLPVMLEKPPCHDLPTGARIRDALAASGLLHSVAFPTRYNEGLNETLGRLRGQKLSMVDIVMETPMATRPVYDNYPDPYLVQRSGGLVGDQGIHYIDVARYITGAEAVDVAALGANRVLPRSDKVTTCDTAGWVLVMDNQAMVTHAHVWGAWRWKVDIRLVTDTSTVIVDGLNGGAEGVIDGQEFHFHPEVENVEWSFALEHRAFIEAVTSRSMEPVRCTFTDALESFALAEKITGLIHTPQS